jgi:integrase
MLTSGVPLKVVSEILGHSSIAITGDVYGHVAPDVSRGAMNVLGAAFPSEGGLTVVKRPEKRSGAAPDLSGHGP